MDKNYTIEYKKIKNFILRVYPDGSIKVSVPVKATQKDIDKFLNSKSAWLEKTLNKMKSIQKSKNDINIKFLGKNYELKKQKVLNKIDEKIYIHENNFCINFYDEENAEKLLFNFKNKILSSILEKSIKKYSKILDKNVDSFRIKNVKTFWGAYHSRKNYITFNINLVECDIEFIDYVVLHEMCHIFHMNHQKSFWLLIEKYKPNYKEIIKRNKIFYF